MSDIGPGPLICLASKHCNCGEGVTAGSLYQCTELTEAPFLYNLLWGCGCGEEHPWVKLQGKTHIFCPGLFAPLGDPDAVIRETDEPSDAKRREDDCYDLPAQTPVKETENV